MAACTSAVDYYGQAKPVYYAVARAYAPVHVSASFETMAWHNRALFEVQVWANSSSSSLDGAILDARLVGPDGVVHVGREAIRPGYHEVIGGTVRVESINTHVEGNSGWDWTNFYVTPEDPKADPFSFVIIFLWEKRQGKWWCVGDMFVVGKYDAVSKH